MTTKKSKKRILQKQKSIFDRYINVSKILISKKESYGTKNAFKCFIGYNDNDVIRPLCVRLPQMTSYAKKFVEYITMSFRANNKQLLKSYNKIWQKVEKLVKINFESQPVYGDDDKYIKTKIKIFAGTVITNFHDKKVPKEKALCKCLSIIMLDSVIKANKKHYTQTLLKKYNFVQEKVKIENYIDGNLEKGESNSDSNDETESDTDNDEYDE